MAKDKKSFILYCDIIHTVEQLNDVDAGKLFKHVLRYVNDLNPEADDIIIKIAFEPIKQQLKRDLEKYERLCVRNAENGKSGGRPRKPKKPNGLIGNSEKPKKADNDNDSDNDVVNDINKRKLLFKEKLKQYLPEYGKELLNDFFLYWSEHNENGKRMRWEKERTFGMKARLNTWQKRTPDRYKKDDGKFKAPWS
jgi:hypothetical protein